MAKRTLIGMDKDVGVLKDVYVWGSTRDSADVSARVCKAIFHLSLDGKTTTPQPAIITSKTKAQLLPSYFRDAVLRLAATGIIKGKKNLSSRLSSSLSHFPT